MPSTLSAAALVLLASSASAYPSLRWNSLSRRQDAHPYIAPGATDGRTACPGLNTMANHGFINRDGRAITKQTMQQGFLDAFGMGFDATDAGGTNSINLCSQLTNTTCTAFDLVQLNTPHAVEHDGSLSREDAEMAYNVDADNHSFNQTIWDMTMNVYGDATHINVSMANTARLQRIADAKLADAPNWFIENDGGSGAEHAFTLTTMNDPEVGDSSNYQARVDWVNYWFVNERLPTDLGWAKPTNPVANLDIGVCANSVFNAPTFSVASYTPKPTPTPTSSVLSSTIKPVTTTAPSSTLASTFISTVVSGTTVSVQIDSTVTTFTAVPTTSILTTTAAPSPATYTPGVGALTTSSSVQAKDTVSSAPAKDTASSVPAKDTPSASASVPAKDTASASVPAKDTASSTVAAKDTASSSVPAKDTASSSVPAKDTASSSVGAKDTASSSVPAKDTASSSVPAKDTASSSFAAKDTASSSVPAKDTASSSIPAKDTASPSVPAKDTASSSVPAKDTATSVPAKDTATPSVPAKDTASSVPAKDTATSVPAKDTATPSVPAKDTASSVPAKDTATSVPAKDTATATPAPSTVLPPAYTSAVSAAAATASAIVGPAPKCPNPYDHPLSPQEWGNWGNQAGSWVQNGQNEFNGAMNNEQGGRWSQWAGQATGDAFKGWSKSAPPAESKGSWMGRWRSSGGWSRQGAKA